MMSTKNLDINLTDGANYNAGHVGENRAVELFIHVPQDMYSLDHNYRLVFSNGVVTPMLKIAPPENDREDGVIRYLLESELTSSSNLGMQLEEYGEDGLIDKSSVVSLKFGSSLSKQKEIFFNKDIILEINDNTIFAQKHQSTLDSLSVVDGELYVDGKPIVGVVVWHIVDDPVNVPSMDDGTLLFISPGINGDMSYPPYKVLVLGAVVTKIAPWKPGQLWVCRGGVWFLLATANRQEYTPEEVLPDEVLPEDSDIPQDVGGSVPAEEEVYEVDPCENVDKSGGIVEAVKTLRAEAHTHSNLEALEKVEITDDVVLLPFGEPLDLYLRADYLNLQYPIHMDYQSMGIEVKSTDNRYIGVYAEGNGVMLRYYDGEKITESYNGFQWSNGSSIHPVDQPITDFSVYSVGYFNGVEYVTFLDLDAINGDRYAKFIYRLFCQIFNTSAENMGSIDIIDNAIEHNISTGIKWGRTYNITVTGNSYELVFDNSAELPIDILGLENDAYCVVYLTLEQDCDIVHEATLLVNGESPNTTAGRHKWIFNRLPDGTISLGALDLEAIV